MADKDGTKPLSSNPIPHRILQDLFAPNKLSTNSSADDEDDKLPMWREDVEASSNDSKSEEDGDYSTVLQQDPCDSSSGATEIVGGGIEESVETESLDSVQLDHFASKSDNKSVTLDGPNCTFKLQGEIAAMLLEHQRDGLKWLWSLHCQGKGGILGDDMGLGKTMQICSFLAGLFNSRLIKRALVVAPKTLLPHWVKELSVVGLHEETRVYHGTLKKAQEEGLYCIHQKCLSIYIYLGSTDDQIVDRACRIGQEKEVVAYRLVTCGTLEEKAYRKQVFKDGLCKMGTEHKEKARHFSQNDHRYPFTSPKKGFDVSETLQQLDKKYDWEETMDDSFKEHMDFLRSLGIAGVSHHNVLISLLEASDDEDDPKNYGETRAVESDFYPKRARWRSKSSSASSLGKLSEKENHEIMGPGFRKLDWNSIEWKHRHRRQKSIEANLAELRNILQESKPKYPSQLDKEVTQHGVAISSPITSSPIKHTQCQQQKSNESITSRLINRAQRLFKILR